MHKSYQKKFNYPLFKKCQEVAPSFFSKSKNEKFTEKTEVLALEYYSPMAQEFCQYDKISWGHYSVDRNRISEKKLPMAKRYSIADGIRHSMIDVVRNSESYQQEALKRIGIIKPPEARSELHKEYYKLSKLARRQALQEHLAALNADKLRYETLSQYCLKDWQAILSCMEVIANATTIVKQRDVQFFKAINYIWKQLYPALVKFREIDVNDFAYLILKHMPYEVLVCARVPIYLIFRSIKSCKVARTRLHKDNPNFYMARPRGVSKIEDEPYREALINSARKETKGVPMHLGYHEDLPTASKLKLWQMALALNGANQWKFEAVNDTIANYRGLWLSNPTLKFCIEHLNFANHYDQNLQDAFKKMCSAFFRVGLQHDTYKHFMTVLNHYKAFLKLVNIHQDEVGSFKLFMLARIEWRYVQLFGFCNEGHLKNYIGINSIDDEPFIRPNKEAAHNPMKIIKNNRNPYERINPDYQNKMEQLWHNLMFMDKGYPTEFYSLPVLRDNINGYRLVNIVQNPEKLWDAYELQSTEVKDKYFLVDSVNVKYYILPKLK